MQIDTLRYFVELARVGSFYGASKNVFISQQGLNRAISSLESELGVKLVERESRGVRLTSSGEVLLEHSAKLLLEYSDMLKDLYAQHTTSSPDDARIVIHMTYYPSQVSEPFVRSMKDSRSIKIVDHTLNLCVDFKDGHYLVDILYRTETEGLHGPVQEDNRVRLLLWEENEKLLTEGMYQY